MLTLGKALNRKYSIRLPFLDGYYNIDVFFHKNTNFLLFAIEPDFSESIKKQKGVKVKMFKNIESSLFCSVFLNTHRYINDNLDILNQFKNFKTLAKNEVDTVLNETITLSKTKIDREKYLIDLLNIMGFSLNYHKNEFIFLLAERQCVSKHLRKKIVRTSALQIATSQSFSYLNSFEQKLVKKLI